MLKLLLWVPYLRAVILHLLLAAPAHYLPDCTWQSIDKKEHAKSFHLQRSKHNERLRKTGKPLHEHVYRLLSQCRDVERPPPCRSSLSKGGCCAWGVEGERSIRGRNGVTGIKAVEEPRWGLECPLHWSMQGEHREWALTHHPRPKMRAEESLRHGTWGVCGGTEMFIWV